MTKRALIVDDSRSARVILSRMLEGYGLQVDSSESAEHALEYLRQTRPDVIFMDHLMPGMDGFQAIQAIKGNPDTAMIPVVMYTSQEGELYVSQARALGAVGVLPKTVKQADVSRVLYQLRLLPERREQRQASPAYAAQDATAIRTPTQAIVLGEIEAAVRGATAPLLKEHNSEMRRFVLASLEAFARRIGTEMKPAAAPPPEPIEALPPPPPPSRWPLVAAIAALALLPTVVLAVLHMRTLDTMNDLARTNTRLNEYVQEQQLQLASLRQAIDGREAQAAAPIAARIAAAADVESEPVPYGEAPLGGARLERMRDMITQLKAGGFHGTLKVATYVGEFCLVGNGIEGYSMAADDLPASRCDLRGNPFDDGLSAAQRQSLPFANLVASLRQDKTDQLRVEVEHEGRKPVVPYPRGDQLAKVTAGDWNKIAAQNNRVEFAAQPAGS
ncbi:MAG TPA: response regulator [Steroidobacteraceae bacterium]|jgi:CheY-like chemotaxis protein|nr:response regulator [Steroidobacteraceae bacterium]